jgi:hypothetical protein
MNSISFHLIFRNSLYPYLSLLLHLEKTEPGEGGRGASA